MGHPSVLLANISQLATPVQGEGRGPLRGEDQGRVRVTENAYILVEGGRIRALGPMASLPEEIAARHGDAADGPAAGLLVDCTGCTVTPGLVDPHTHAVFGGWRAEEFFLRLEGAEYADILAAGGGILDTVRATRRAGEEELYEKTAAFLDAMVAGGTTTVEIKSGYGLDLETEMRQLRVIKRLDEDHPIGVAATFMGAHAVPPEYEGDPDGFVDFIIGTVMPAVVEEGLSSVCDVFCEEGVFGIETSRRLLTAARGMGMAVRLHADEIVPLGGAGLAAEVGAVSADHLLQAKDEHLEAMAAAGVTAVVLPGTAFFLRKPYARARDMLDRFGLPVALATDFNPGSCPLIDLRFAMTLACVNMGLTAAEALTAATLNAAHVLGMAGERGSLEVGKAADLVVWNCPGYEHLIYRPGAPLARHVFKDGRRVAGSG